jgi:predicted Zn finger-like uncharacterized protein
MILTCPSCHTRYLADAAKFQPAGRTVRCANCGHSWHQQPPEDAPRKVTIDEAAQPEAMAAPLGDGPQRGGIDLVALVGWAVLLAVLAGVVYGAYAYRIEVVRAWPQAASLYEAVGITINTRGLEFRHVHYTREFDDGTHSLAVRGEILNVTDLPQTVPHIRVTLRDEAQNEIHSWTFPPPETVLDPGKSAGFTTRMTDPPVEARDMEVRFVEDQQ